MRTRSCLQSALLVAFALLVALWWTGTLDAAFLAGTTVRVSVASDGSQGYEQSYPPALNTNGHLVAFSSAAHELVPGDTNGIPDTFIRDMLTAQTERISLAYDGSQAQGPDGSTHLDAPAISGDGNLVAFGSFAVNLVPDDTNNFEDVFVRDRAAGQTTRVSVSSTGAQGDDASSQPVLSSDGRYVAFTSWAANLVPDDTNGFPDIFVRDRVTGAVTRVSVSSSGAQGNHLSVQPAISADGRLVAFASYASNLVSGDTNGVDDIFVHDRLSGETTLVSVSSAGVQSDFVSREPALSGDGRYVAFISWAANLVPGDTNGVADVFVRDRVRHTTIRVSLSSSGTQANGLSWISSISGEGRYVAFGSRASNLVPGDTNEIDDVFVHDNVTGETVLVSAASDGTQGNWQSSWPSISANGRWVGFMSFATNLVPGDTNDVSDTFLNDRGIPADVRVRRIEAQPSPVRFLWLPALFALAAGLAHWAHKRRGKAATPDT